jgi:hypothetical protein
MVADALIIAPVVAGAVAAATGGALILARKLDARTVSDSSHTTANPGNGDVIPVGPRLAPFSRLSGAFHPLSQAPHGAKRVPILDLVRTRPAGGREVYSRTRSKHDAFVSALDTLRDELRAAGLGRWDARCVICLHVQEVGWTWNGCFNRSRTNIKAKWSTYASPQSVLEGWVLTTRHQANGIHILRGRYETSLESYYAYGSWEDSLSYEAELLTGSHYGECGRGYEQGGLDGLVHAQAALGTDPGRPPGWSYATTADRIALAHHFWDAASARAGSRWVR